jgi:hypothetical protein
MGGIQAFDDGRTKSYRTQHTECRMEDAKSIRALRGQIGAPPFPILYSVSCMLPPDFFQAAPVRTATISAMAESARASTSSLIWS